MEAISQALERHHRSVSNLVQRQGSELQNMISMLAQTIRSLGSASEVSARNLDSIAGQLKQYSALEDIYQLRLRLGECLKNVRDEATRQRTESESTSAGNEAWIGRFAATAVAPRHRDRY